MDLGKKSACETKKCSSFLESPLIIPPPVGEAGFSIVRLRTYDRDPCVCVCVCISDGPATLYECHR